MESLCFVGLAFALGFFVGGLSIIEGYRQRVKKGMQPFIDAAGQLAWKDAGLLVEEWPVRKERP